jgi:hypothetical protein
MEKFDFVRSNKWKVYSVAKKKILCHQNTKTPNFTKNKTLNIFLLWFFSVLEL